MKYIFFIPVILYSCCPKIVTTVKETNTVYDTTTIETRVNIIDTLIKADTLTQVIQLECDSVGNVKVKSTNVNKGKRSHLSMKLSNNILYNRFVCDSLYIELETRDSLIRTLKEKVSTKETVNNIIEYRMAWWCWILIGVALAFSAYSWLFKR
jgi:hypothetical protein